MQSLHRFSLFFVLGIFSLIDPASPLSAQDQKKSKGPERYESAIAAFELRDKKTPPGENLLLFVGSSSIRKWDLEKFWPGYHVLNNGFGGSTLADSIFFFDRRMAPYRARAIVLYAGDNDIARGLDAEGVLRDFKKLTDLIEKNTPGVPVIFIAIKPSIARWKLWPEMKSANDKIAAYCQEKKNLYFADIAAPMLKNGKGKPDPGIFLSDGLHLNDRGYQLWKQVIAPILDQVGLHPKAVSR